MTLIFYEEGDHIKKLSLLVILLLFLCSGCSKSTKDNDSPEVLFQKDPSIDLFVYQKTAYVNASLIDWVKELKLEPDQLLGTIQKTGLTDHFSDWDATKLEQSVEVYSVKERNDLLLVLVNGEYYPYLKYVEG